MQYKTAIQLGDSTFNITKRLGASLCYTQKYEEALNYNLAVYKIDTTEFSTAFCLSENYLGLKNYDKSIEFSKKTIKLLSFERRATALNYDNMVTAYTEKKEYINALKMYDKKFEIVKRKYIIDYYKMAILYDKLNLKKEAIKYYQKVIDKSLDKTDSIYKYSKSRIDVLTEDIFFEGK